MEYTEDELKRIDEGVALEELKRSAGGKVLYSRIDTALDAIEKQLVALPLETAEGRAFSPESIGLEYQRLSHLKQGIQSIKAEVEGGIRRAKKLQDKQNPPA